jgi:uncharacterized protein (DUF433 family)
MATQATSSLISLDARGRAVLDGTRYKVLYLAGEHHHYGWTAAELLRQHPDLRPDQVYAALAYFYEHHDAMIEEMAAASAEADAARTEPPVSREELLLRRDRLIHLPV